MKLFRGSAKSWSVVGSFLKPLNWPLSLRIKYRGRQVLICSPKKRKFLTFIFHFKHTLTYAEVLTKYLLLFNGTSEPLLIILFLN